MKWIEDKKWSDKYIPNVKVALGLSLIQEAPLELDVHKATDLILLTFKNVNVACRLRRQKWLPYKDEFTVRESRPNGTPTELEKILAGFGTHFFYGICDDSSCRLLFWRVSDLDIFRSWFKKRNDAELTCGYQKRNIDNSSTFRVFKVADLPASFTIAEYCQQKN